MEEGDKEVSLKHTISLKKGVGNQGGDWGGAGAPEHNIKMQRCSIGCNRTPDLEGVWVTNGYHQGRYYSQGGGWGRECHETVGHMGGGIAGKVITMTCSDAALDSEGGAIRVIRGTTSIWIGSNSRCGGYHQGIDTIPRSVRGTKEVL